MGLTGSLRTLPLPEIVQTLGRSQATGVLRLVSDRGRRDVIFNAGEVVRVVLRDEGAQHTLIERLVAMGVIDEQTAQDHSGQSGGFTTIGALVGDGAVTEGAVAEAMVGMTMDEVYDLMTWENATFVFDEATEGSEAAAQVAEAMTHPLTVPTQSLLMEGARRLDEWKHVRDELPPEDALLACVEGREEDLAACAAAYPAGAVARWIDGVRSLDEILHCAVCTRLDTVCTVHQMLAEGLLRILELDEMVSTANVLMASQEWARAAEVYRRLLAFDAGRDDARENLAACLEALGDAPEAAGAFAQLASALLHHGDHDNAVAMARRAASLAPVGEHHLVLVRCLLTAGDQDGAIAELAAIARHHHEANSAEEERSTWLKVLQLDPDHAEARRELARMFSEGDGQADGEDIVVCVECGHSNPRGRDTCASCSAPLHLACLHCQRVVAVSDRICIFCGRRPHVSEHETERRSRKGPATAAIVNHAASGSGGSSAVPTAPKGDVEMLVHAAREMEAEGRHREALAKWRTLAQLRPGNDKLLAHLRDLEVLLHDQRTEALIERGNLLRSGRRFRRAERYFQEALRGMQPDDERAVRLVRLVGVCRRNGRLTAAIYAAAGIILLVVGALVARPHVQVGRYRATVDQAVAEMARSAAQADPFAAMQQIAGRTERPDLAGPATRLGLKGRMEHERALAAFSRTRDQLAGRALAVLQADLAAGRAQAVREGLDRFRQLFGQEIMTAQVDALRHQADGLLTSDQQRRDRLERDPLELARLDKVAADGRPAEALAALDPLLASPHDATRSQAAALKARLAQAKDEFTRRLGAADALAGRDLSAGRAAFAELSAAAPGWGLGAELAARVASCDRLLAEAATAWGTVESSDDTATMAAFLDRHPAAPQAGAARERLQRLTEARETRERALSEYRAAVTAGELERALSLGLRYATAHPDRVAVDQVRLPLLVEAGAAGATLAVDGTVVGGTDERGRLLWWYEPGRVGALTINLAGHDPVSGRLADFRSAVRWPVRPQRSVAWVQRLASPAFLLQAVGADVLAQGDDAVVCCDGATGKVRWRLPLGDGGDGERRNPSRAACAVALPGGRLLLPLPSGLAVVEAATGRELLRLPTPAPVQGLPAVYVSELTGAAERVACVAGGLRFGPLTGGATLESPALRDPAPFAGVMAVPADLETLLIFTDARAGLSAVEESSRKPLWRLDAGGTDLGHLLPLGRDRVAALVDGSRLVAWDLRREGAVEAWRFDAGPMHLVAQPRLHEGRLLLTGARELRVLGADGVEVLRQAFPSPATCPAAIVGSTVAVGVADEGRASLLVCVEQAPAWRRDLPAAVHALAIAGDRLIVGLADGAVMSFVR